MSIGRVPGVTGIQPSIVDAKGDLIVATAADSVDRLAVGTNEQRLVADSATATGLKYVADTTNYAIAAKGDLLVGTAADTLAALTVGTNGHTLVADSATSTGLKWGYPNAVGCAVYTTTASWTFTSGVWTSIAFPSETFDTNAFHSTVSNTSRLTIPSGFAGKYIIHTNFEFNGNSSYFFGAIRKNGNTLNGVNRGFCDTSGGNNFNGVSFSVIDDAIVGDYYEVFYLLGQASGTLTSNNGMFSIAYLGV